MRRKDWTRAATEENVINHARLFLPVFFFGQKKAEGVLGRACKCKGNTSKLGGGRRGREMCQEL